MLVAAVGHCSVRAVLAELVVEIKETETESTSDSVSDLMGERGACCLLGRVFGVSEAGRAGGGFGALPSPGHGSKHLE